jgi:hypothetical protein
MSADSIRALSRSPLRPPVGSEIVTRGMPADDAGLRHEALKQAQEDLDGMLAV